MAHESVVHFLTHVKPVAGCEACVKGAPAKRSAKDLEILASMSTLRDDVAKEALSAVILASPPYADPESAAKMAFSYADAFMAARGAVPDLKTPGGRA